MKTSALKRLLTGVREYKKESLLTPLTVGVEVILEVMIPLLMTKLIDNGIKSGDTGYIVRIGALLIVICILSLFFGSLSGTFAARASAGFAKNLRHDMYYNVQNFSFSNIDKFSTASIVTRLTTDVTNVQTAYMMTIRMAARSPIMLVFALIASFSMNARIALVFLCAVPVLGLGLYVVLTRAYPVFERVFKTYDRLNGVVQENLRGVRVVKSFVREDFEIEKFNGVSQDIYKDFTKAEKIIAFAGPIMQICMYGCLLIASWMGAEFIVGGTMSVGELSGVISYAMSILSSLMMLSMVFVMITISRASMERIAEVLEEQSDITDCEEPIMSVKDGSVDFEHVDFGYGKGANLCLSDIDIHIKQGETIGIIGGTGASKSSLVQLIPRLYDVLSGCVKVGGEDVRRYDIKVLRDEVAMVLQKNELFSGTIKENLRWGNENASDDELVHACELAQADSFVRQFPEGYDTYIEQGGTNVSGGQKQRLCIARALLKKPKILILDDSTSAVDTATDALIRRAFREEIPDTTKFIIAQRISSIEDADRTIVLDGGKINGIGTHSELLENNMIYREVYDSQMKGGTDND